MDIFSFCKTTRHEDGFDHTFRTMDELTEVIEEVLEGTDEIRHVRWQGIPDALSPDAPIPYADQLATDVSRHWHDGIPKIQLYALRETADEEVKATYLYGIVYDPANGNSDWDDAWSVAGRIRGRLDPSAPRRKHPGQGGRSMTSYSDLSGELRERMRPHIGKVCHEKGPSDPARQRAQKALRLLRQGKGGERAFDSLFELGPPEDDRTVAALWWLYRTNQRAKKTLDAHRQSVPALVFEEFTEARPGDLFGEKSPRAKVS